MTERGRKSVSCTADMLQIGPSSLVRDGDDLLIHIDEMSAPLPRRIRGTIRVTPEGINPHEFTLDTKGDHFWRPIAPSARVSVEMNAPELSWSGNGYLDMNHGSRPLEEAFSTWTWSRASLADGAAILYDAQRREAEPLSLALKFDRSGAFCEMEPPPAVALPRTNWFMPRDTRSEDARARVVRTLEDTPFYSRSELSMQLFGERVSSVHESLSLDRVSHPIVRLMLPFRMPRRA